MGVGNRSSLEILTCPSHSAFCSLFFTHCRGPCPGLALLVTPSAWPQGVTLDERLRAS